MNHSKWLSVIGGIILFIGLSCALLSNHYEAKVMGNAALGIAIIGPNENSPAWKEKIQTRQLVDIFFYFGIFLTAIGIVLQTVGSIDKKINLKAFLQKEIEHTFRYSDFSIFCNAMIEYKGYLGDFAFDPEIDAFHGTVININDVITFYGSSVTELREEMQKSIEEYLVFCQEQGREPKKTFVQADELDCCNFSLNSEARDAEYFVRM